MRPTQIWREIKKIKGLTQHSKLSIKIRSDYSSQELLKLLKKQLPSRQSNLAAAKQKQPDTNRKRTGDHTQKTYDVYKSSNMLNTSLSYLTISSIWSSSASSNRPTQTTHYLPRTGIRPLRYPDITSLTIGWATSNSDDHDSGHRDKTTPVHHPQHSFLTANKHIQLGTLSVQLSSLPDVPKKSKKTFPT